MTLLKEFRKTSYLVKHYQPHKLGEPILRASSLSKSYNHKPALTEVSFELKVGERVAVIGPNGAGKSTLFKIVAGILTPTSGEVHIYGHEPGGHICIAYLPQRSRVDWGFPVNVAEVVMMGRIGKLGLFRHPRSQDWEIVNRSLRFVNLENVSKYQIGELSGGQQQRMFIARALAQEAELMLMDEPLAGLDASSRDKIFDTLDQLQQRDVTVLIAMHDLKTAAEQFDRVMLLKHKLLGFGKFNEVFTPENLLDAYGNHLHLVPYEDGMLAMDDTCCEGDTKIDY